MKGKKKQRKEKEEVKEQGEKKKKTMAHKSERNNNNNNKKHVQTIHAAPRHNTALGTINITSEQHTVHDGDSKDFPPRCSFC